MLGEEKKCQWVSPLLTQRNQLLEKAKGKGGKVGGIAPRSDFARIIRSARNRPDTLAQDGQKCLIQSYSFWIFWSVEALSLAPSKGESSWYSDSVLQGTVFIWDCQGLPACLEVQLKGWNMEDPASSGPEKLAVPRKGTICDAKPTRGGLLVSQGPAFALTSVPTPPHCWPVNQCKSKSLQRTDIPDLSCARNQRGAN